MHWCYTSKVAKKWFNNKNIPLFNYLPQLHDMNIIKNEWGAMANFIFMKMESNINALQS